MLYRLIPTTMNDIFFLDTSKFSSSSFFFKYSKLFNHFNVSTSKRISNIIIIIEIKSYSIRIA